MIEGHIAKDKHLSLHFKITTTDSVETTVADTHFTESHNNRIAKRPFKNWSLELLTRTVYRSNALSNIRNGTLKD